MFSFSKSCRQLEIDRDKLNFFCKQLQIVSRKPVKGRNWQYLRQCDFQTIKHAITLLNEGIIGEEEISLEQIRRHWRNKRRREHRREKEIELRKQREKDKLNQAILTVGQFFKMVERAKPPSYPGIFVLLDEQEFNRRLSLHKIHCFNLYMMGHSIRVILAEVGISRSTFKRWKKSLWWQRLYYEFRENCAWYVW